MLLVVALVAGNCSSDSSDDDDAAPTTTTERAVGTTETTGVQVKCEGIGAAPGSAEVTWVENRRLWSKAPTVGGEPRCLAEVDEPGDVQALQWGGAGDRLLVNSKVLFADSKVVEAFATSGHTMLSRPKGTSVVRVAGVKLSKRELDKAERDVTFMDRHDGAVYHPAGTHIVSWGANAGTPMLVIASNNGADPRDVVTNESGVKASSGVAFTASGALLYVADHGDHVDHVDMHRLVIGEQTFSTVTTVKASGLGEGIFHVAASPFEGGGVAWNEGHCSPAGLEILRP